MTHIQGQRTIENCARAARAVTDKSSVPRQKWRTKKPRLSSLRSDGAASTIAAMDVGPSAHVATAQRVSNMRRAGHHRVDRIDRPQALPLGKALPKGQCTKIRPIHSLLKFRGTTNHILRTNCCCCACAAHVAGAELRPPPTYLPPASCYTPSRSAWSAVQLYRVCSSSALMNWCGTVAPLQGRHGAGRQCLPHF